MHYLNFLYPALVATSALITGSEALRSGQKIKLSNVQSLTLRKDKQTSHRRVSAIPQVRLSSFLSALQTTANTPLPPHS